MPSNRALARRHADISVHARATIAAVATTTVLALMLAPLRGSQQPSASAVPYTDGHVEFEVASVKTSPPDERGRGFDFNVQTGRLAARNQTLKTLITFAYADRFPLPFPDERLSGGPDWLDQARFTIDARAPEGSLATDGTARMALMLRSLLEARFSLIVEMETKPATVYGLVLARRDRTPTSGLHAAGDSCSNGRRGIGGGPGVARLTCATMTELAWTLSELVDRPVVDDTGLSGGYDATLEWAPAEQEQHVFGNARDGEPRSPVAGPSIFTALQEQLGLKLDSRTGRVDFLVVKRAQKPSPN